MHLRLQQLIDESCVSLPLDEEVRIELIAACFVYAYHSYSQKPAQSTTSAQPVTFEKLNNVVRTVLNLKAPLKVRDTGKLELETPTRQFITNVEQMLNNGLISCFDLSTAIKQMYSVARSSFTIPEELCQLGVGLLGGAVSSVYTPFEKGCEFSFYLPGNSTAICETASKEDFFYAHAQNYLLGKHVQIVDADPIAHPKQLANGELAQFQSAIAMPPFGLKMKGQIKSDIWGRFPEESLMGEVYFLRHMLAHAQQRVVCFVSDAFLFRTAGGERLFKEDVIDNNWLEGVIALPSGLLNHTSISVNALVFNKTRSNRYIKFFNASSDAFIEKLSKARGKLKNAELIIKEFISYSDGDNSTSIKPDKVFENECNLSPARYVKSGADKKFAAFMSHFKPSPLTELVDIFRPQALQHDESGETVLHEYGVNNLNDIGHLCGEPRVVKVKRQQLKRIAKQKIQPHDVLVVCRGAVGKVGYVPERLKDNALVNQAFTILRIKPGCRRMSPQALFQYLSSEYGKHQLTSLATGTSAPMLSSKDIQALIVPAFSKEQQETFAVAHQQTIEKQEKIDTLQKELAELRFNLIEGMAS